MRHPELAQRLVYAGGTCYDRQGLYPELLTKFDTLDRMYEALDAGKQVSTPANEKSLRENRAAVELSRKLVALRFDVPIRFDDLFAERKVQPLTTSEPLPSDGDPTDEPEASESSAAPDAPASVEPTSPPSTASAPATTGTTAVNALVPVEYERQLEPRSLRAAVWLGQHLHSSRLYEKFKTPEAVTAVPSVTVVPLTLVTVAVVPPTLITSPIPIAAAFATVMLVAADAAAASVVSG